MEALSLEVPMRKGAWHLISWLDIFIYSKFYFPMEVGNGIGKENWKETAGLDWGPRQRMLFSYSLMLVGVRNSPWVKYTLQNEAQFDSSWRHVTYESWLLSWMTISSEKMWWGIPPAAREVVKLEQISPFMEKSNGKDLPHKITCEIFLSVWKPISSECPSFHLSCPFIPVPIHWVGDKYKDMVRICFIGNYFQENFKF